MNMSPTASISRTVGNARRFARQHGGIARYSHERAQWLIWNGKHWQWDNAGEAVTLTKRTVRSIYGECEREPDKNRREALGEHARKSESDARIRAMLHLAQSEVAVRLDELDRHPFLFNCQNGIVNLETGELMEHNSELMLTKISPVAYDPDATCPRFQRFLAEIMDVNESLMDFLQSWFGYCMTADVREHAVAFFHGTGANGKTTLLDVVTYAMGDYAGTAAPGLLMSKKFDEHATQFADLLGKRLVITVETQEGRRFNESIIKWLSGGDKVKGRWMREDFFEFAATHKFTLAANHRPVVTDTTDSFWRRLKLVPFNVQIPTVMRDKALGPKLKGEASGILSWMVAGAVKWRKDGLPEPPEITVATDDYRGEQDSLAPFLAEHCEVTNDNYAEAQVGKLYERFKHWSEEMGEKPVSSKRLSAMFRERGFENYQRTDHKYYWRGLTMREG